MRIAVVEDHQLVRDALVRALDEAEPGWSVGWVGDSLTELLAHEPHPDLVLLDVDLHGETPSMDDVATLTARGIMVLVVSALGSPPATYRILRAGAAGVVAKQSGIRVLVSAMKVVAAGGTWLTPDVAAAVLHASTKAEVDLTAEERQVLSLYAAGLTIQAVAHQVHLSPNTVKYHLKKIRAKFGAMGRYAPSQVALYQHASELGLLEV